MALIGLEIHGYLFVENNRKLFCNCSLSNEETEPNTNICPICTGQPGAKPMLPNKQAVEKVLAIALMLDCEINKKLVFQRKHYDWPDLPKGFQITMSGSYALPVGFNGRFLGVGIQQIHLEEDPARWNPNTGEVDYNRSGYPLVEIVTNPDLKTPEQVGDWLRKLWTTLSYIRAIDRKAGIKCDVNVNIESHPRVEVKNINSFSSIVDVVKYELERQKNVLKDALKEGKKNLTQETRAWTGDKTVFMRSKEKAEDYRFIPEPDLPVINVSEEWIRSIASKLPEKPEKKLKKLLNNGVGRVDAEIISSDIILATMWEFLTHKGLNPVTSANWIRHKVLRVLNDKGLYPENFAGSNEQLFKLISLAENGVVNDRTALMLLSNLVDKDFDVEAFVKKHGLTAIKNEHTISKLCEAVINKESKAVNDYLSGVEKAMHYLKGKVMALSKGKADPNVVEKKLRELLKRL